MLKIKSHLDDDDFSGGDVTMVASMLKLKAGRLAREITDSCLQYWGGMGFTNDVYVSRFDRHFVYQVMIGIKCSYVSHHNRPLTQFSA